MDFDEHGWIPLEEFPGYIINPSGEVSNEKNGRTLIRSPIRSGIQTVGFTRDGVQYRRSVAKLIAEIFSEPPMREDFDTVMHLDGDKNNCAASNLTWRPRWFAIRHHQNREAGWYEGERHPFICLETNEVFTSLTEPSIKYGLLEHKILEGLYNQTPVFPLGFNFAEV